MIKLTVTTLVLLGNLIFLQTCSAQEDYFLLVPGVQAGLINDKTSEKVLKQLFGTENVIQGEGSEGLPTTIVYPNQPDQTIYIYWDEADVHHLHPIAVEVMATEEWKSKWHLSNGVSIGTSLETLDSLNQREFKLNPYGSCVGGDINSWNSGKLDIELPLEQLRIKMNPSIEISFPVSGIYKALYENEIQSSSTAFHQVKPKVSLIGIDL